jgi:hypothetical protein
VAKGLGGGQAERLGRHVVGDTVPSRPYTGAGDLVCTSRRQVAQGPLKKEITIWTGGWLSALAS